MRRSLAAVVTSLILAIAGCTKQPEVEVIFGDGGEGDVSEGEGEVVVSEGEGEVSEGEGDGGPVVELVDVGHTREMRGAWIATVYGINWPSNPSGTAASKEAELVELIETLASRGVNTVFFQVRPESDAMYASDLEPWSRFLTGTQGRDPGFDPLQVAIDTAHAHHVELHAWLNPYRGLSSSTTVAADNHVTRTLSQAAINYDGMVWMDPASTSVRAHVVDVVRDIATRYNIDGIHFDDYFYPYPSDVAFPDAAAFTAYQQAGGGSTKAQWRRDNVNALIADVAGALAEDAPAVRFGVSPFGIYKDGVPAGIHGLDAFSEISCDPVTWIDNDWVDYLAPQLYWPTSQTAQAFGTLLPWWASLPDGDGRFVVAGLNLADIGSGAFDVDEYRAEVDIIRNHDGAGGAILWNAEPLITDQDGIGGVFATELWSTPALPPPVVADASVPAVLDARVVGSAVNVAAFAGRSIGLYEDVGGSFALRELVPVASTTPTTLALPPGRYALTAVGKNDRESRGVVVTVP